MNKKLYARGMAGQYWYNFTECLAWALQARPVPKELMYEPKISYGDDKMQFMNLFYPKADKNKKKPLFIYVHGGGWISGLTGMRNSYVSNWAKEGFFVCSISYSYAPQKIYPEQLKEIFSAVDFIFDNAEKYNIDTSRIVLGGESAGGYYISFLANAAADKSVVKKLGIDFKHNDEFSVRAMVSHCGAYNLERLLDNEKPQSSFPDIKMMLSTFLGKNRKEAVAFLKSEDGKLASAEITKGFPPVFLTWATMDKLRFEAFDFMKQLDALEIPYEQFKADGIISQHAWTIVTVFKKGKDCFEKSKNFVLPYLK